MEENLEIMKMRLKCLEIAQQLASTPYNGDTITHWAEGLFKFVDNTHTSFTKKKDESNKNQ